MALCQICGQRLAFGGNPTLRKLWHVADLITELEIALRRADQQAGTTPPIVRSAILSLRAGFAPLISEGSRLVIDLHEAAHDRHRTVDRTDVDAWEERVTDVLREVLMALNSASSP